LAQVSPLAMKIGMAMGAARFAAVVLPALLVSGLPVDNGQSKAVISQLLPGQAQPNVLAAHTTRRHAHDSRAKAFAESDRDEVPEMLEAWVDSGLAVPSLMAAKDIVSLTKAITADAFSAQLHALVDPASTRFIAYKGNELAAANIKKEMDKIGLQTEMQPLGPTPNLNQFMKAGTPLAGNVLGLMKGTDRADEVVIVACHYDSVNWEDITAAAPGVDDNGSGVALMLLLAKSFAQMPTKPRRSILFVSFQAEEEGLVGSKKFAQMFQPKGIGFTKFGKPVAAIVADEIAWPGSSAESRKVIFETKGKGKGTNIVVDTLAHASQQQCAGGFTDCVNGFVVNYHGFGSDHIPMLDVGIPAVLLIERDNMYHADKWGHSAEDTFKHIDPVFGAATTRMALQAVAALANPKA